MEEEVTESQTAESDTYFFYRLGEICFTPASQLAVDNASRLASSCCVSTAPHYGWTAFADQKGMITTDPHAGANFLRIFDAYSHFQYSNSVASGDKVE